MNMRCIASIVLFVTIAIVKITFVDNREISYKIATSDVRKWAEEMGDRLWKLSDTVTRRSQVIDSFAQTYVADEDGFKILKDVAGKLQNMMQEKTEAVRRIMVHAEKLALNRKPDISTDSTFDYFDANNVSEPEHNDTSDEDAKLAEYLNERKVFWEASSTDITKPYVEREPGAFRYMPMVEYAHFKSPVNINFSAVRVAVSLYSREKKILNDVRWSEALDETFKENFHKDPSLSWQYFGSSNGFLRLYPAIKWSEEQYDQTYDYRIRSWYTDAMTSPKDVVILVDRSGSMLGNRRLMAKTIVNDILDTLNDNDFVNVYTFTNTTEPLVDCFGDNLVQANEENLRLLRESLAVYNTRFAGDISLGFHRAFKLLARYRGMKKAGAQCNQAIMLITEGIDYDYKAELFKLYNRPSKYYRPVRVFTYQLGSEPNDGVQLEWIACANMGFYVNISLVQEVHEKTLKYLNVMSRPVNMRRIKPEPLWSALYVDLADRKLSNWLWQKFEGNRQRDAFVELATEESKRLKWFFKDNDTHFIKVLKHEYEKYKIPREYFYMTTVSLPAFDFRENSTTVLGVAAVDVSREYVQSLISSYRLGANGYAFILTNNGYLMLHPDHRTEFQNILKPTFNRVDMTEVEILDDENEPRLFGQEIVELRKNIVQHRTNATKLKVKAHVDNMKRLFLETRHYYYTKLEGPFSLVLALPDKYGSNTVRHKDQDTKFAENLKNTLQRIIESKYWRMHPDWLYCKHYGMKEKFFAIEEELIYCLKEINATKGRRKPTKSSTTDNVLVNAFLKDFEVTDWFDNNVLTSKTIADYIDKYLITLLFMATHTGMTRWQTTNYTTAVEREFIKSNNKAIDEVWYRRAVEQNYSNKKFIYSLPYHEYLDYDVNTTMVTAAHAVFKEDGNKKAPAATIAYQFYQKKLNEMFISITTDGSNHCDKELFCYMIDNNGYVITSSTPDDVGKFLADVKVDVITDVLDNLVSDGIFKRTRFFDYQAICFYDPKTENPAPRMQSFISNLLGMLQWALLTVIYHFESVFGARQYKSIREKTLIYEKYAISKSVPTPCDKEMWLYNLNFNTNTQQQYPYRHQYNKTLGCSWSYYAHHIPKSNLLLLAVNVHCRKKDLSANYYKYTPTPKEIIYNVSLPCYIATQNNFTRGNYIECFNHSEKEDTLNLDKRYCAEYEENKKLRLRLS